ncbi:MAG: RNA polymerase sigma factor [Candidatus Omnitrophota bacterium]
MKLQAGDAAAIEEVFAQYKKPLFNYALRVAGNRADAEDVVSEVFLALSSHKYSPRPDIKFSTWAYAVAHNFAISIIRKRKTTVSFWFQNQDDETEELQIADTSNLPNAVAQERENAVLVKRAIGHLNLAQKEAIILREYHSLSYDEISQVMNITLEKVKILIFRAREQLKKELLSFLREELP